ncbi:hypothetical protein [Aquimarina agarivorans]|uniref:hypothetical protein n=1 Tax=Aquimarina agarivorans TaxID=980584 RepID=UPI0002DE5100|nr:hypothetical protein [Aquimarina agarivorans]
MNRLQKSGSKTAFGLIDYDNGNNHESSVISILGNKKRYSIENYILDPIFIAFFILREIENKKLEFGFDDYDKITNFQKIGKEKLQNIVDKIIIKIEPNISNLYNSEIVSYRTLNDYIIKVPIWYFKTKGHILEEIILKSIYDLRGFMEKNSICPTITKKVVNIIPEFIALDLLKTFEELEYK